MVFMCVTSNNDSYVHSQTKQKQQKNTHVDFQLLWILLRWDSTFTLSRGDLSTPPVIFKLFSYFFRRSMRIHHPFGTSFPGVWSALLSGSVDIFIYSEVHRKSRLKSTWYCDSCYYCVETQEKNYQQWILLPCFFGAAFEVRECCCFMT